MTSKVFKNDFSHKSSLLQLISQKKIRAEITGLKIPFGSVHKEHRQLGGRRGQKLVKKGPSINDVGH